LNFDLFVRPSVYAAFLNELASPDSHQSCQCGRHFQQVQSHLRQCNEQEDLESVQRDSQPSVSKAQDEGRHQPQLLVPEHVSQHPDSGQLGPNSPSRMIDNNEDSDEDDWAVVRTRDGSKLPKTKLETGSETGIGNIHANHYKKLREQKLSVSTDALGVQAAAAPHTQTQKHPNVSVQTESCTTVSVSAVQQESDSSDSLSPLERVGVRNKSKLQPQPQLQPQDGGVENRVSLEDDTSSHRDELESGPGQDPSPGPSPSPQDVSRPNQPHERTYQETTEVLTSSSNSSASSSSSSPLSSTKNRSHVPKVAHSSQSSTPQARKTREPSAPAPVLVSSSSSRETFDRGRRTTSRSSTRRRTAQPNGGPPKTQSTAQAPSQFQLVSPPNSRWSTNQSQPKQPHSSTSRLSVPGNQPGHREPWCLDPGDGDWRRFSPRQLHRQHTNHDRLTWIAV